MSILEEANEAVQSRQAVYGSPIEDFKRIAGMWSAYLDVEIKPHEIADLMCMLKFSRSKTEPHHRDNMVDTCGYQLCKSQILDHEIQQKLIKDGRA